MSESEEIEQLRKQLQERDEQVVRAAEFGQHLVQKNKTLETRMKTIKEENRTLKDQIEDVTCNLEFLKNELESTESVFAGVKKERNLLKAQNEELLTRMKGYENDLMNNERVIENNTKLRKQVTELQEQLEELKKKSEKQRDQIDSLKFESVSPNVVSDHFEKPMTPRGVNPDRNKLVHSMSQEAIERIEREERKATQKVNDLNQQIRTMQSEKDIAHIQHRVQINQFRTQIEELQIKLRMSEEFSDRNVSNLVKLRQMGETIVRLKAENSHVRKHFMDAYTDISQQLRDVVAITQELSGTSTDPENSSANGYEMSYALLQQKVIEELGLDDYYTSFGHGNVLPSKEGYLMQVNSIFSSSKRYIKISVGGLSLYATDKDNVDAPICRYSLIGAKIIPSQKKDGRFDLKLVPAKVLSFDAKDEFGKEEWVSLIRRILKTECLK